RTRRDGDVSRRGEREQHGAHGGGPGEGKSGQGAQVRQCGAGGRHRTNPLHRGIGGPYQGTAAPARRVRGGSLWSAAHGASRVRVVPVLPVVPAAVNGSTRKMPQSPDLIIGSRPTLYS